MTFANLTLFLICLATAMTVFYWAKNRNTRYYVCFEYTDPTEPDTVYYSVNEFVGRQPARAYAFGMALNGHRYIEVYKDQPFPLDPTQDNRNDTHIRRLWDSVQPEDWHQCGRHCKGKHLTFEVRHIRTHANRVDSNVVAFRGTRH